MTLGRWVSLSGAAFSSALGARTTVPLALLATFANVRLGYWWDSGLGRGWTGPLLPVYRGLLSECLARLRGTGIRLWNLTDGGHFENLGGYELIRRLRSRPSAGGGHLPAIAVTAYASIADGATALAAGYQAHIAKPFYDEALVRLVATRGRSAHVDQS